MRWVCVLAGGVGSRFWPASTAARPKQLLPLAGPRALLTESVERILPLTAPERVLVITSAALQGACRAALPMLPADNILAEPAAKSTAPALAWATLLAAGLDREASLLSVHADWAVGDPPGFRSAASAALDLAEAQDVLVTVGLVPTRPETGFGWIVPGAVLSGTARRITRFVEKPGAEVARQLMDAGALWNSGMFAWTARRFRAELEAHTPELIDGLRAYASGGASALYAAARPVSVDVGLFERTQRGAVLPGSFAWDDVGSWAALTRVRAADAAGNVVVGDAHAVDAQRCVVWSDDGTTVLYGVRDLVVVRSRGVTLVTTAERAPDLKRLLDRLPPSLAGDRGS